MNISTYSYGIKVILNMQLLDEEFISKYYNVASSNINKSRKINDVEIDFSKNVI
jgi:hypothetical protein